MVTTKKKAKRSKAKAAKKLLKAAVAVSAAKHAPKVRIIEGAGDYRPTRFARVAGRGDYVDDLKSVGSGLASGISLAKKAFGGIKSLFGFGDYRTGGPRSNSLMHFISKSQAQNQAGGLASGSAPSEAPFNMGALSVQFAGRAPRVSHREFIGPVVVPSDPTAFNTSVYRIQPGLKGANVLFPWGSSVAGCFKQYVLHGMILEFHSTSSELSANTALGSVMMSTVYDSESVPLATQTEIDNNEYTTSDKPSNSFYHPIECASNSSPTVVRYVRKSNAADTSTDSRLDDVGIFQLSTIGLTAPPNSVIGELWATYDIEFLKAELPDLHEGTTAYATGSSATSVNAYGGLTLSSASSLPVEFSFDGLGLNILKMPKGYNGNYLLAVLGRAVDPGNVTGWTASLTPAPGIDITGLPLLPTSTGSSDTALFTATNNANFIALYTFSTIAENAGPTDNEISLSIAQTSATATAFFWTVMVVPLDNDVAPVSASFELSRLLVGNPRQRDALAILLQRLGLDGSRSTAAGSAGLRRVSEGDTELIDMPPPATFYAAAAARPSSFGFPLRK